MTKNKKTSFPHRNPAAIPARMRHAGPMKNNKDKRTNEGEDWSEEIEEYTNMSTKTFTVNASTQIIIEAKDENEAVELAELTISKMLGVDFIYKINDQVVASESDSCSISVNESGAIVYGEQKSNSSFTRVLPLDMSKTMAEDILLKQPSAATCFAEAVKNNALRQKEDLKKWAKKISEKTFDENEEASKCFKIPDHWDKFLPEEKDEKIDFSETFFSGRDCNKPIYVRKDQKAYIYHNLGEENTAYEFAIFWNDGTGDGDCCASLTEAITTADKFLIESAGEKAVFDAADQDKGMVMPAEGYIVTFDKSSCKGTLKIGEVFFPFEASCFHSGRPARFPQEGEEVDVFFRKDQPNIILTVIARSIEKI